MKGTQNEFAGQTQSVRRIPEDEVTTKIGPPVGLKKNRVPGIIVTDSRHLDPIKNAEAARYNAPRRVTTQEEDSRQEKCGFDKILAAYRSDPPPSRRAFDNVQPLPYVPMSRIMYLCLGINLEKNQEQRRMLT